MTPLVSWKHGRDLAPGDRIASPWDGRLIELTRAQPFGDGTYVQYAWSDPKITAGAGPIATVRADAPVVVYLGNPSPRVPLWTATK